MITSMALVLSFGGTASAARPESRGEPGANRSDNLKHPLGEKQNALRQKGQEKVLAGKAVGKGPNKVVEVAKGQYVELAQTGEDLIWSVLGEFGEGTDETHGGTRTHADHGGDPGPLHNEIAAPDRSVDNATIWTEDFSQPYFEDLLFSRTKGDVSMANLYAEMSSGRYSVDGDVADWVPVPNNAATYGSDYCGSIVCQDTWFFVQDSLTAWYDAQVRAGQTPAQIDEYLSQYDVWDRYDHDGDGNFNEADGYIDHFQSIHAGEGQETGGGVQGDDAIWSHRWYVQLTGIGAGGPTVDGAVVPFGGTRVGQSKYWVGDYTIEPENGGVGVFAHEFAHDLGLPDLYDTSGNTGGAENSTGFWTLMSSGSYGNDGTVDIGSKPIHMGAWEKFQLGWLNYKVAFAGEKSSHKIGPAATSTKQAQGLFVVLPKKAVQSSLGAPFEGAKFYYSGSGDGLDNTMTKSVTLPAGSLTLTSKVRYEIETDWDYAYLTVNGGIVATNLSTNTDPNGQNFGNGITGSSGGAWVDLTADLSAYAGQTVTIGFRYWTDGAVAEPGFQVDALTIPGQALDGAEADAGWTFTGFGTTTGSEVKLFDNYYLAEFRQYRGFDTSLKTGPYNFGFLDDPTKQNWVEHFSYQDGLLINYWDTSMSDNNVGDHPGEGLLLPIDANPQLEHWTNGTLMRPRIQAYDSTFGLQATDGYTLHNGSVPATIASKPAVPVFDDRNDFWTADDGHDHSAQRYQPGWNSVKVPKTGTKIRIVNYSAQGNFMQVNVN